jgi:protein ImuA
MPDAAPSKALSIAALRRLVAHAQHGDNPAKTFPFGVPAIDAALPGGGLALGAVHEFSDDGPRGGYAANALLFVAGILARLDGPILWCLHSRDLFAPALMRVGLDPGRIIFCETWKDADILPAMEEGLRVRGLAGVVGELTRLPLTPSRRLQLAAETSGVSGFVISRAREHQNEANAAFSRWRIAPAPSLASEDDVLGRARWRVDLVRCRGAAPHSWILEACDAEGRCALPADVPDRSFAADERWRAAG